MSSFKDAVQEDLNSVFLNLDEFAETHTVYYDGEEYSDIPIVMTGLSEKERVRQSISDHAEGIYRVSRVLHCDIAAIGGKQPEQGCKLGIDENGFVRSYYVASPTSRTTMPRAKPTSSWKFMPRSRARPRPKNWLPKSSGCTTSLSVRLALPTTATRARLQA